MLCDEKIRFLFSCLEKEKEEVSSVYVYVQCNM